jgi:hypothetical protein
MSEGPRSEKASDAVRLIQERNLRERTVFRSSRRFIKQQYKIIVPRKVFRHVDNADSLRLQRNQRTDMLRRELSWY